MEKSTDLTFPTITICGNEIKTKYNTINFEKYDEASYFDNGFINVSWYLYSYKLLDSNNSNSHMFANTSLLLNIRSSGLKKLIWCFRLWASIARAKVVYDYLAKRGIDKNRMSYVGMGSRFPTGRAAKFDRRVEIEIISTE